MPRFAGAFFSAAGLAIGLGVDMRAAYWRLFATAI